VSGVIDPEPVDRPGGHFVVVMQEQYLAGVRFPTAQLLEKQAAEVAVKLGGKGRRGSCDGLLMAAGDGSAAALPAPTFCQTRGVIDLGPFGYDCCINLLP
jgi:hypothetical protein